MGDRVRRVFSCTDDLLSIFCTRIFEMLNEDQDDIILEVL